MDKFLTRVAYTIYSIALSISTLIMMVCTVWYSNYYVVGLSMEPKRQRISRKKFNKKGAVSYLERLFNNAG